MRTELTSAFPLSAPLAILIIKELKSIQSPITVPLLPPELPWHHTSTGIVADTELLKPRRCSRISATAMLIDINELTTFP